jgi:hypothetical protein
MEQAAINSNGAVPAAEISRQTNGRNTLSLQSTKISFFGFCKNKKKAWNR